MLYRLFLLPIVHGIALLHYYCNICKFATKELSNIKFDGKSGSIHSFHEKLLRRAEEYGWNQGTGDIITVYGKNYIH